MRTQREVVVPLPREPREVEHALSPSSPNSAGTLKLWRAQDSSQALRCVGRLTSFTIGYCWSDLEHASLVRKLQNDDLLGSLKFACAVAGAKVILLFGHTACGAVKGAIDDVEIGNLTGLLARIKPAISATKFTGEKSSKNAAYVDAVARTNVLHGLEGIRRRSRILAGLENKGTIQIAGAMYDLATGTVEFFS